VRMLRTGPVGVVEPVDRERRAVVLLRERRGADRRDVGVVLIHPRLRLAQQAVDLVRHPGAGRAEADAREPRDDQDRRELAQLAVPEQAQPPLARRAGTAALVIAESARPLPGGEFAAPAGDPVDQPPPPAAPLLRGERGQLQHRAAGPAEAPLLRVAHAAGLAVGTVVIGLRLHWDRVGPSCFGRRRPALRTAALTDTALGDTALVRACLVRAALRLG